MEAAELLANPPKVLADPSQNEGQQFRILANESELVPEVNRSNPKMLEGAAVAGPVLS